MYKVLLVDDEKFIRKGLYKIIDWQKYGFEICDEAEDGVQAYELIQSQKPDLVITDIKMPVLDGLDLIKRVVNSNNKYSPKFIILSGFNEFKFAQQAIRYGVEDFLLKPINEKELNAILEKLTIHFNEEKMRLQKSGITRKIISEAALERLIKGSYSEWMLEEYAPDWYSGPTGEYNFCIIEVFFHPASSACQYSEHQLKRQIGDALSSVDSHFRATVIELQPGKYGMVLTSNPDEPHMSVQRIARSLQSELLRILDTPVAVYIGDPVNGIRSLQHSYQTAVETSQYKFLLPDMHILDYQNVREIPMQFTDLEDKFYSTLLECVEDCDADSAAHAVESMFLEFRQRRMAPQAVHASLSRCFCKLVERIKPMEDNTHASLIMNLITEWEHYPIQPAELQRMFMEFVMEHVELNRQIRKNRVNSVLHKTKTYIEMHYSENLTLKLIAEKMMLNPVYLGQLFKKTYGVYFNEFLMGIRIQEAKKLLRQTDLRVYEISDRVGIKHQDYFVNQFKRMEKMTPTEYRQQAKIL
ncbi:response regulator [Neobacillus drentensis]|uniref:response regulator n=1 Tax=Neobacillus drentensis TaxID=220684 RepID=UPI002FFFB5F8